MKHDEMAFFHEGTMKICGNLDIDFALQGCFAFLKQYMPVIGIFLTVYEMDTGSIRYVAEEYDFPIKPHNPVIQLSPASKNYFDSIHKQEWAEYKVDVVNHPDSTKASREISKELGLEPFSHLVLHLKDQNEKLGVVVLLAKGSDKFTKMHGHLMTLLHDPFAMAMSNALRYREVLSLKEMLKDDNRYLLQELHHISGDEIIGQNFGLRDVMEMVRQVAPLESQVLLLGETGVGKEVIANAIHYSSPKRNGPFIKVNCGAIPESLLDSELFGHEKGAFTGAFNQKRGRFERADKGTIFLDEIGELPLAAQIRLLRVIQSMEIERVGSTEPVPINVRIIAATHRDLPEMVKSGAFREDLWFRINVFPITIPPLRHRKADIPALVNHFIERKSRELKLTWRPIPAHGTLDRLQQYAWPGNIRELENVVERELILSQADQQGRPLQFKDFLAEPKIIKPIVSVNQTPDAPVTLDEIVRNHIRQVMDKTRGKIQGRDGAAALLGLNPSTLRNRMRKLKISFGRGVDIDF